MTQGLPQIPYTTLGHLSVLDGMEGMSHKERAGAVQMMNWLVARLEDEADENLGAPLPWASARRVAPRWFAWAGRRHEAGNN